MRHVYSGWWNKNSWKLLDGRRKKSSRSTGTRPGPWADQIRERHFLALISKNLRPDTSSWVFLHAQTIQTPRYQGVAQENNQLCPCSSLWPASQRGTPRAGSASFLAVGRDVAYAINPWHQHWWHGIFQKQDEQCQHWEQLLKNQQHTWSHFSAESWTQHHQAPRPAAGSDQSTKSWTLHKALDSTRNRGLLQLITDGYLASRSTFALHTLCVCTECLGWCVSAITYRAGQPRRTAPNTRVFNSSPTEICDASWGC